MKRLVFIYGDSGRRRVTETDFPLSVGGSSADIVLLEGVADTVVAHIALSSGHAYVQPVGQDTELFHNHEYIQQSAWLKSGDRVQWGDRVLCWDVKGDQVFVKVRHVDELQEFQAPAEPPPEDDSEADTEIMPVVPVPVPPAKSRRFRYLLIGLFSLLSLLALFVLFATPLAVNISPEPEEVSISGFPPPVAVGSRKLVVPGTYRVKASRQGYLALEQEIEVSSGGFQAFEFELQELPGKLHILVDPVVPVSVMISVMTGEVEVEVDPDNVVLLERGLQQITIETDRYLPESREVDISGFGAKQEMTIPLRPALSEVQLESEPAGASISVDGEVLGVTPMRAEIMQGLRNVELSLAGYKPALLAAEFVAGTTIRPDVFNLVPNDGRLILVTKPEGVTVSIDGNFIGSSPVTVDLASGVAHQLRLSRPGYKLTEQKLSLEADEKRQLVVEMRPEYGVVFASSVPADAKLTLDGKPAGNGTQRLRLTTRQHQLTFSKPGYLSQTVRVTPRLDTSQTVEIELKTQSQTKADARPDQLKTAAGQDMRLLEPASSFEMGASRREAGRRANESQRLVEITRPFYLSVNEVTNAEYRLFNSKHNSGSSEGMSLNNAGHPVVNISWDEAARYCNWLSEKDNLKPAYIEKEGRMQLPAKPGTGYRLPTEAEWVYAARVAGRSDAARYPWGEGYPPTAVAGNFADAQIADALANVVTGYNDGYRASAPVGSFSAQPGGFNDLGGNVSEWINDFYAVYPGQAGRLVKDPMGPATGDHHVVRGSSWRDGSITELRLSYRDYSRGPRDNLGFRIARYADE